MAVFPQGLSHIDKRVGRTSVLKLNYRNTAEVLALAMHCAESLLVEQAGSDEQVQTVHPASAGRRGPMPTLLLARQPGEEAESIAKRVAQALSDGRSSNDVAVLLRVKRRAMPRRNASMDDEVRLLYVGVTRATEELLLSAAGDSTIVQRVRNSLEAVARQFSA